MIISINHHCNLSFRDFAIAPLYAFLKNPLADSWSIYPAGDQRLPGLCQPPQFAAEVTQASPGYEVDYQLLVWSNDIVANPKLPLPEEYGWEWSEDSKMW